MSKSQDILNTAKAQIGKIKYVFGGNNPSGGSTDCSGFTQYVYAQNGIKIGRTTQAQWTDGTAVEKSNLKAGDLVFFKNTYNSNWVDGVSHVGIYIGNGKFYHNSSSKGGIAVGDLNDKYWTQHYLGARNYGTDGKVSGVIQTGLAEDSGNAPLGGTLWDNVKNNVMQAMNPVITTLLSGLLVVGGVAMIVLAIREVV